MASVGYTASVSRNLLNRSFPIQNLQSIDRGRAGPVARPVHRQQRHAQPGDAARAEPVPAGERPAPAVRRRAGCGDDRAADDALPVSAASVAAASSTAPDATADYHAMLLRVSRAFRAGHDARRDLHLVAGTWRTRHRHRGRPGLQRRRHRHELGHQQPREQPHARPERCAAPARRRRSSTICRSSIKGQASAPMQIVEAIAGDWQVGGSVIWQTGFPIAINGASTGAALARPDRVEGVRSRAAREPVGLVRRPDGGDAAERTRHHAAEPDLPQIQPGRVRRPRRDDAERARSSRISSGTATRRRPTTRSGPTTASTSTSACAATFAIARRQLEFGADAMNVLNHTQFSGAYNGALGGRSPRQSGARARAGDGQREQLRHARDGHVQSAADSVADVFEVLKMSARESQHAAPKR